MTDLSSNAVWVVIAAFNEASVIADVISDVKSAGHRVVVVDDGSTDGTADITMLAGVSVVKHPFNLGQGAALQTGLEFALANGAEVLVTFDADGQHRAADISKLVETLHSTGADFVLGSRFLGQSLNMPRSRRIALAAATWFTRLTTGLRITDTHNGLRAITRRGARSIHLHQNGMAHASEILHQVAASGLKYVEAPVTIDYSAYSLAKGQKLRNLFSILIDLFARRLHG